MKAAYRQLPIGYIQAMFPSMGRMDSTNISQVFGEVLRRYRSDRGITQEELAFQAGVDRTFIYRMERGIRQPTITTLLGMSRALGVSAVDLVRDTEEEYLRWLCDGHLQRES
jgi:transcriptional regulator with XRE-family HTH domain